LSLCHKGSTMSEDYFETVTVKSKPDEEQETLQNIEDIYHRITGNRITGKQDTASRSMVYMVPKEDAAWWKWWLK